LLEKDYSGSIGALIKGHAGIYALYKGERLYYVGLATNLMGRVKQHFEGSPCQTLG
jgi:predicted GIY-YIG superfamily endonuclease